MATTNVQRLKLAVFDIDGTIKGKAGIPPAVREGFLALHRKNILTTVITGKGYTRVKESLGRDFDTIISPDVLLVLENGGRIIEPNGQKNIRYFPLSKKELVKSLSFVKTTPIKFLAYYPKSINSKAVVWSGKKELLKELKERYGYFSEIIDSPLDTLGAKMETDNPCMLSIKLLFLGSVKKLTHMNAHKNEGIINLNADGINKNSGLREIAKLFNVKISEILIAGNEHNDLPLMRLQAGRRIIVGNNSSLLNLSSHKYTRVKSPRQLGLFLQSIK